MAPARTHNGRDLYEILGVPRDADEATLKKTYRKLAQQYHPDMNADDPGAEERFKKISHAYAILSDPERRKSYDEFGHVATDPNFDAEAARRARAGFRGGPGDFADMFGAFGGNRGFEGGAPGDLSDLFENLFTGGRAQRPRRRRGADLETFIDLEFAEAALGTNKRVDVTRPGPDGLPRLESLTVRVPPGVNDGARIRLAGKGRGGSGSGPPGDLYARVRVRPHRLFQREGCDIHLEVPVSVTEAVLGTEFEIPTLEEPVRLRIPPGTDGGSRLRLRGKGVPAAAGKPAGHLYVTVRIKVPKQLDDETRLKFEELSSCDPTDLRRDLLK
jgi:DnaJ-class molecular chaperone